MQVAVAQVPLHAQQQVAEETLQIDGGVLYPFRNVAVVGADESIAKIPRVPGKLVVVDLESQ